MKHALFLLAAAPAFAQLNYEHMADRIAQSLAFAKGERVIVRYDPGYFHQLTAPVEARIKAAGAVVAAELPYRKPPTTGDGGLSEALKSADVYLWMPFREDVMSLSTGERRAIVQWLEQGGTHREVHFHWAEGTMLADGIATKHPAAFDRLYQDALDIDYAALSKKQDRAIAALRQGIVHVTTPQGTDLTMRVGGRPFNKQDGDGSPAHARAAKVRVDREVELPAGVLRVAPLEIETNGTLAVPEARFGKAAARGIRFTIVKGRITKIEARENLDAVENALKTAGDPAFQFREIGIGVNPKLALPPGSMTLPYYGYGDALVRLSLGDNQELGGNVRGGFVRWFFFPNATVTSDAGVIVKDGKLAIP